MANEEQLKILKQGVRVWNEWRRENPDVEVDLSMANLWGINLAGYYASENLSDTVRANLRKAILWGARLGRADLKGADLSEAVLARADLTEAYLNGAILVDADLSEAYLWEAKLRDTNLRQANLRGANLWGADLSGTDLNGADLAGANLYLAMLDGTDLRGTKLLNAVISSTLFSFVDLSEVIDIERVIHQGPSNIGIETIFRSKGKIPEVFLRGCGFNDLQIETSKLARPGLDPEQVTDITYKIHQLYIGGGIQYYSCFISYSNKDHEFAQHLHDDLQNNGVRCWFAPEDMKIGDPIRPTIDRQIRLRDKLLVILSENSVKSEWVGDEVEGAIEEEAKSIRLVLFPIRLDDTVFNTRDDWAAKIKRRRHIGDFSNWKDKSSYQIAFERLLRDLKASSEIGSKDELE